MTMNSVIKDFINTNKFQNVHYSLEEIVRMGDEFKREFLYEHKDEKYIATVKLVHGYENDFVKITLGVPELEEDVYVRRKLPAHQLSVNKSQNKYFNNFTLVPRNSTDRMVKIYFDTGITPQSL
jgi:hypothetical protein